MAEKVKQSERLNQLFSQRFGHDWRSEITLTLRTDVLYWLVYLVEVGIETRTREMKADQSIRAAEMVASICSWEGDLKDLADRIERVITPISKTAKK